MRTIIPTLIFSILLLNGCATWKGVKQDSSDAWDATKKGANKAYTSTKRAIHEATDSESN